MNFKAVSNFNQSSIFLVLFHAGKVKQNHSNLLLNACRGIILPPRDVISQNQSINRLIQFKESVKKLLSNFPLYTKKKIRLNTYVFHRKSTFLYILSKMKALRGIILPETYTISLNDSIGSPFPFNIPFHPGEGPEIDYPNEPEYPEEDPGDDPDD